MAELANLGKLAARRRSPSSVSWSRIPSHLYPIFSEIHLLSKLPNPFAYPIQPIFIGLHPISEYIPHFTPLKQCQNPRGVVGPDGELLQPKSFNQASLIWNWILRRLPQFQNQQTSVSSQPPPTSYRPSCIITPLLQIIATNVRMLRPRKQTTATTRRDLRAT